MKPEQRGMTMSLGSESIPMTIQAQIGHMSLEEAVASGLFDLPDAPGMVRIPVAVHVTIPHALLKPPAPAAGTGEGGAPQGGASPAARATRPRRRFGSYPRGIAAQRVMERIAAEHTGISGVDGAAPASQTGAGRGSAD